MRKLIKQAHQEAHECNASKEVHDWIDWFNKKLNPSEEKKTLSDIVIIYTTDRCAKWYHKVAKFLRDNEIPYETKYDPDGEPHQMNFMDRKEF